MATERQVSFEDMVRAVDPDYDKENQFPIVYFFKQRPKREDQTNLYSRTDV